jgi:uncharacterized protein YpuA (DUF1002 family)
LLESKKNILNIISSENKIKVNESFNLPISSMLKVANQNLNDELKNISESDMKEIESLSSMSKEELKENISKIQESIIPKLKSTLNESSDSSVKSKIEEIYKLNIDQHKIEEHMLINASEHIDVFKSQHAFQTFLEKYQVNLLVISYLFSRFLPIELK